MNSVIVYYSNTGNNRRLAKYIKSKTKCDIFEVLEKKKRKGYMKFVIEMIFGIKPKLQPYKIDLKKYDRVIMIAPFWFGQIASPMRVFMKNEKENIKKYAFFSISGGNDNVEKQLEKNMGKKPTSAKLFSIVETFGKVDTDVLSDKQFDKFKPKIDQIFQ